jgi:hypothetical protein
MGHGYRTIFKMLQSCFIYGYFVHIGALTKTGYFC